MKRIILASASPRRAALMTLTGLSFLQEPAAAEEAWNEDELPEEAARKLAIHKAARAAAGHAEPALIIGADTMVVLDGVIIGKPSSRSEAGRIIRALNGREHLVMTGVCVFDTESGQSFSGTEITRVVFRDLQDYEIEAYLDSAEFLDKAGASGIQEKGAFLVASIDGCYYNVVGLPLNLLRSLLLQTGVDIWRAMD